MTFAYSQPPLGEPAHPTATYLFTALMAVFFIGLVAWALLVARRERTWLPIACMLGGLISFGFEPVLDSVAHIFYPLGSPLTAVTIFDTTIPWFVVMAYVFWVGAGALLVSRWFEQGRTGRDVMVWFLAACALEVLFEYPAVLSGALFYYGDQPFKLFGYPLYWPFTNAGAAFAAGYVIYLAKPHLAGARGFAVATLIPPLVFFAFSAMGSWPVWLAINGETSMPVIWLAGAVAIALQISLVRLVAWAVDEGVTLEGSPGQAASRQRTARPEMTGTAATHSAIEIPAATQLSQSGTLL